MAPISKQELTQRSWERKKQDSLKWAEYLAKDRQRQAVAGSPTREISSFEQNKNTEREVARDYQNGCKKGCSESFKILIKLSLNFWKSDQKGCQNFACYPASPTKRERQFLRHYWSKRHGKVMITKRWFIMVEKDFWPKMGHINWSRTSMVSMTSVDKLQVRAIWKRWKTKI